MSYQFETGEDLPQAVRRVAREELEACLDELERHGGKGKAVHNARKHLKKLRALLRLVRCHLPETRFDEWNTMFRDVGRQLSKLRDAEVQLQTLKELKAEFKGRAWHKAYRRTYEFLVDERHKVRREASKDIRNAVDTLRTARQRVNHWLVADLNWESLADSLFLAYQDGRRFLRVVQEASKPENFHEWRKRVKDLYYQLRLLNFLWPSVMAAWENETKALSDHLGKHHDLVVLQSNLKTRSPLLPRGEISLVVEQKCGQLEQLSFELGEKIFHETPKTFSDRLTSYWKRVRAGKMPGSPQL